MCINMRRIALKSGLSTDVPCHCCWQCRADRVKNWVGKSIAESQTSAAVDFVTLTYCDAGSPQAHRVKEPVCPIWPMSLHYEDVQKYLKRIRKAGHRVRYIVAGEYGDRKGRAHWHILLFWQDGRPERFKWKNKRGNWLYGNEWQDEFWHHGHVNYQPFNEAAAKYVCKYLLKPQNCEAARSTKFRYSAKPGIGFNWICDHWAQMHVERGLSPQSGRYTFSNILKNGVAIKFKMSPHCAIKFAKEFEARWYSQKGSHPPSSPFLDKMNDLAARPGVGDALERRGFRHKPEEKPPSGCGAILFDDKLNTYYADWVYKMQSGELVTLRFYWSFNERGEASWEREFVDTSSGRKLRASYAMNSSSEVHESQTMSRERSRNLDERSMLRDVPNKWRGRLAIPECETVP